MSNANHGLGNACLYGIVDTGYVSRDDAEAVTHQLLKGGVDLIQLRAKGWDQPSILELGKRLRPICREAGVPFIINDFPAIAVELEADGLHLGQDDGSLAAARRLVGDGMSLGRSTHSVEQARQALEEGFDYIGFGPLFPTPTKAGRPAIGMRDISQVEREVGARIPVFCIGGIKGDNLAEVIGAGGRRVVIVSDWLKAKDIVAAVHGARLLVDPD